MRGYLLLALSAGLGLLLGLSIDIDQPTQEKDDSASCRAKLEATTAEIVMIELLRENGSCEQLYIATIGAAAMESDYLSLAHLECTTEQYRSAQSFVEEIRERGNAIAVDAIAAECCWALAALIVGLDAAISDDPALESELGEHLELLMELFEQKCDDKTQEPPPAQENNSDDDDDYLFDSKATTVA